MAAICRFGMRMVPNISEIIAECRNKKQLVQGPHIAEFEREFLRRYVAWKMGHLNVSLLQSGDQKISSGRVKTGREKVESFNEHRTADPAFPD